MDRGAWWAAAHRVTKSQTRLKRLSMIVRLHLSSEWQERQATENVREKRKKTSQSPKPGEAGVEWTRGRLQDMKLEAVSSGIS